MSDLTTCPKCGGCLPMFQFHPAAQCGCGTLGQEEQSFNFGSPAGPVKRANLLLALRRLVFFGMN